MNRTFIALAMVSGCLQAAEPQVVDAGFLARMRAEAVRHHPAVASAGLRATAAGQDVGTVRLWDDPMAGLSLMAAPREMRRDDGDVLVGIEQPLPKPGLYAAKRSKAEAMQRSEVEKFHGSALEIGAEAARLAIELALADEAIEVQAQQLSWLGEMAENARQRALDPAATSVDALRLESELASERQMLAGAKRTREGLGARLNLVLGRALESPWPPLALPDHPPPVPVASAEIARIARANPQVRAMREMTAAANAETRIADRERLPSVAVGIESAMYSGGDYRSTTVGVKLNLPWFNDRSYRAAIDAAKTREKAAEKDVASMQLEIAGKVQAAVTEAATAAAQARAHIDEIHPKIQQTSDAAQAAWINSKSMLTDLLDSHRMLLASHLEERRLIALQLAALEELNLLVPARTPAKP
ncbi:TolC family protein [Luteolibacter soli]|uniref:TolC family protein n=1 Tax=Luteolibacter soli TaxID=3135280 RepID=A0ABU9B0D6_9BACT